jgi:hypothetical protein
MKESIFLVSKPNSRDAVFTGDLAEEEKNMTRFLAKEIDNMMYEGLTSGYQNKIVYPERKD